MVRLPPPVFFVFLSPLILDNLKTDRQREGEGEGERERESRHFLNANIYYCIILNGLLSNIIIIYYLDVTRGFEDLGAMEVFALLLLLTVCVCSWVRRISRVE